MLTFLLLVTIFALLATATYDGATRGPDPDDD